MLVSLNWIEDYVELPPGTDPRGLAERFTRTTAEVDEVRRVEMHARGLIAARVLEAAAVPGTHRQQQVHLDVGGGRTVETVTTAPVVHPGLGVVYAPPGSSVNGKAVEESRVGGRASVGMIVPGEAIGISMAVQEAVFLGGDVAPGEPFAPEWFDDWLLEIDNKSITHRPDLWGHYGIAREIAAMEGTGLKPYPVEALDQLEDRGLPEVRIEIDDGSACPRYSGIVLKGVPPRPAPLWMQLRLGRVGMRPITGLVDLTNYVMADLGQPMHAFDADKVDRIEVGWAQDGELFRTLDGVERRLSGDMLMIQCRRKSIALGGVMGGLETEVSETTSSLLLESANFNPAVIRRTAARLGLRTDASTRFEKSLDPEHTVLGIRRFIHLGRAIYPELQVASCLSDCRPDGSKPTTVRVNPRHAARTIGRSVPFGEARRLLEPLGFGLTERRQFWDVRVPSFRATADVTIEDDVIEELARTIGYGTIEPEMPRVTMRHFSHHALHELERRTLDYFTSAHASYEIHGYIWFDSQWLGHLGFEPGGCVSLRNPAAEGLHRLRTTLMPGMLAAVARNRFHFSGFSLIEVGSVFEAEASGDREHRHAALVIAQRGKRLDEELFRRLKGAVEGWAWRLFAREATYVPVEERTRPWEHHHLTAGLLIEDRPVGRVSVLDVSLRRAMDEHLGSWGVAWAEIRLDDLARLARCVERPGTVPSYPVVELDFSLLVPRATRYEEMVRTIGRFEHALLKRIEYVGSYEGEAIPSGQRSLTFRTVIGSQERTLVDEDVSEFQKAFEGYIERQGYVFRSS